jgi:phage shock protein PspC (stress-responsive transcriptional regulator)
MLGGVATGLAAYLGVDVVVVRIAFVVLFFVPFPGFGLLVYGAMLLLVPAAEDGEAVPARASERGVGFYIGIALVGLATFWLLGAGAALVGGWGGSGRFGGGLLPLLLIGLGIALWVDADRRRSAAPTTASGTPAAAPPSGVAAWAPPTDDAATSPARATTEADRASASAPPPATAPVWESAPSAGAPTAGPPAPPLPPAPAWQPPPAPTPRERVRSPLGRVTVGLALLAGGAVWMLDLLEVVRAPAATVLATVLLVLGLGLLVGTFAGRARWLAIVVAFLLPLTIVAAALEDLAIDVGSGVDTRVVTVVDAGELDDPIRLGAGELVVDLSGLAEPGDAVVDASLGAGQLELRVPDGAGVTGTARLEVGELRVGDARSSGVSIERQLDLPAEPGQPTYAVDLRVGAGEIDIRRVPATSSPGTGADTATTEADR